MKLIVQIPCLNEEQTLAETVADIPREIPGIDEVEILVVDDGSEDRTLEVASRCGVDHTVSHSRNRGLARSFQTGLERAIQLGADIIVNTDGDNQYYGGDIARLVQPILEGRADIVIGDREVAKNRQFGALKTRLQGLGSAVVSSLAGAQVPDSVSGFRAISRGAALRLNILSSFSYTTEMIIQAGNKQMAIVSVPVRTNLVTRKSRLFKSVPSFIARQGTTMIRMYAMYRPMRFFFILGGALAFVGLLPILRFLYFYVTGDGSGHLQSLVLGGVLLILGFVFFVAGLLADLVSQNRKLLEINLEKTRRLEAEGALSTGKSSSEVLVK